MKFFLKILLITFALLPQQNAQARASACSNKRPKIFPQLERVEPTGPGRIEYFNTEFTERSFVRNIYISTKESVVLDKFVGKSRPTPALDRTLPVRVITPADDPTTHSFNQGLIFDGQGFLHPGQEYKLLMAVREEGASCQTHFDTKIFTVLLPELPPIDLGVTPTIANVQVQWNHGSSGPNAFSTRFRVNSTSGIKRTAAYLDGILITQTTMPLSRVLAGSLVGYFGSAAKRNLLTAEEAAKPHEFKIEVESMDGGIGVYQQTVVPNAQTFEWSDAF
ncbi:MAG: hypothetical protein H7333_09045 [Bdellovibrionales bacterium]|nr:hypothetical protein [Oligoflexia bacterium]